MRSFLHELEQLILEEWQRGELSPLCHTDPGRAWYIVDNQAHRAVFHCTVIVYLHSPLYSCTHYFEMSTELLEKHRAFGSYTEASHAEMCAISTEPRALGLVGEVK